MQHDPDVQSVVETFQLGLPRVPAMGRSGELLGRGTGSSLEFQEYRQYVPGDDIRHLDWATYARTDTLMVRLYREEVSPRTEILLDASRSMTSSPAKMLAARQLATVFAMLCGRLGGRPAVVPLQDGPPRTLGMENLDQLSSLVFDGRATLIELLNDNRIPLKPRAVRIVISDFLFPHDPQALIRRLAGDASALWIIQVLGSWERDPQAIGGRRLMDVETGGELDLVLDRVAVAEYKQRLGNLQEELLRNCRRVHSLFATVTGELGLRTICRQDLCAAGMLRVG